MEVKLGAISGITLGRRIGKIAGKTEETGTKIAERIEKIGAKNAEMIRAIMKSARMTPCTVIISCAAVAAAAGLVSVLKDEIVIGNAASKQIAGVDAPAIFMVLRKEDFGGQISACPFWYWIYCIIILIVTPAITANQFKAD